MTMLKVMQLVLFLCCFNTLGAQAVEVVDQSQTRADYGFWLDDQVQRWQEFVPTFEDLARIDVWVMKMGNPGDLIIQLTDTGSKVLASSRFQGDSITSGWLSVVFDEPVPVATGRKYRIHVRSDRDSVSPEDRFFWRGSNTDNYGEGAHNDVFSAWPSFDYAFITYGVPQRVDIYQLSPALIDAAMEKRQE